MARRSAHHLAMLRTVSGARRLAARHRGVPYGAGTALSGPGLAAFRSWKAPNRLSVSELLAGTRSGPGRSPGAARVRKERTLPPAGAAPRSRLQDASGRRPSVNGVLWRIVLVRRKVNKQDREIFVTRRYFLAGARHPLNHARASASCSRREAAQFTAHQKAGGELHAPVLPLRRADHSDLGEIAAMAKFEHGTFLSRVLGKIHTNTIEGYFSIFKRGMHGNYQHCAEKNLHRYLAEWPAPGSEDTKFGVTMGPEVGHAETEIYAGVQA